MQLKDLQKGDRFRLPMGKMVFRVTEIYQETIHCVDGMSVSFTFPSDWECEKVEEETKLQKELKKALRIVCTRYERHKNSGNDYFEESVKTDIENIGKIFEVFNQHGDNSALFTREDMMELLIYTFKHWSAEEASEFIDNFLKSRKK